MPPLLSIGFITIAVSLLRNPKSQSVLVSTIKEAHQHLTSQIHGQSSKTPPSAGSDSDVLDDGVTKEMLGLRRAVVNWKIEHMSRGSKIKGHSDP
ncbi:uncharacterized protein LOC126591595 isoform X2 [Malus sylvestris]|uniref:uncharacterized protein LOC126591595 isoform X2 n=1 Tax=Malus sylvestris TaxID=3752 RepID=UPI0021ACBE42|nr:uncharacterized protein LOC126591595 isoform X2 [Malus sylvestris]